MMATIPHRPPTDMLAEPTDTTSNYLAGQMMRHMLNPRVQVHTRAAMAIAAHFQAPDNPALTAFAGSGWITDDLLGEIAFELHEQPGSWPSLVALGDYVQACGVIQWYVGRNIAGSLPASEPDTFLTWEAAVDAYRELVEGAAYELVSSGDCTCCPDPDDCDEAGWYVCDFCGIQSVTRVYMRDKAPDRHTKPREASVSLRPESEPFPMEYWIKSAEVLVSSITGGN